MTDYYTVLVSFFGGLVSTLIMTIYEIPFWKKWGLEGILEWHENQILFTKLFKLGQNKTIFFGIFFLHFLNGGLGGLGFLLLLFLFPDFANYLIYSGLLYGVALWVITLIPIHKPITGINPFNHPLGFGPALISLTGHLIYGATLSFFFLLFL